jgi:ATP-dependent Clp protease ATP-binding subunit ClpX
LIAHRLNTQVIGFGASKKRERVDKDNLLQYIAPPDLRAYGMIPEIIGRLPVVTHLNPLDREALRAILTEPKNALIKQYIKLFKMDGIELTFADNVLDFIVDKAIEFKLGARGLRSICEAIMLDAMFESPSSKSKELAITIDYASHKLERIDLQVLKAS